MDARTLCRLGLKQPRAFASMYLIVVVQTVDGFSLRTNAKRSALLSWSRRTLASECLVPPARVVRRNAVAAKKRAQATKRQANRGHTKPKLSTRLLSARVALSFAAACARWRCSSGATPSESSNSSVPASPHCPVTRHHIHARHAQRQDRRRCNVTRRCRRSIRSCVISRTCH